MQGFNTQDYSQIQQLERNQDTSDSDKSVEEQIEINKLTFKDERCPDLINYSNLEHDKAIKKYRTMYNDCDPNRKIVDKLNIQLLKEDIDKYIQDEYVVTEGMMCYFINYLINYQRLQKVTDKMDLMTYFLIYEAKDNKLQMTQTYHPLIKHLKQCQKAHSQLLQPSIEDFKQKSKINNIREYKYLALIINGNQKWFLCIFDLKFKEAYYFDFSFEPNSEIKKYDSFFEDLVQTVLGLDYKGQVIHDLVTKIKEPGDRGDLIFYTLYRLLLSKKRIELTEEFLIPNDIKRAKTRCTWIFLTQMLERDTKQDAKDLKRGLKKFQSLQALEQLKQNELDKKDKVKKQQLRLKQKEQLLFVHMLNDARQEVFHKKEENEEEKKYQILLKKLAVFNVHSQGNRPVSEVEAWVTGKKVSLPDHFYNFEPMKPSESRAQKRDFRALVKPDNYYSIPGFKHQQQQKKQLPKIQIYPQSLQVSQQSIQSMQVSMHHHQQNGYHNSQNIYLNNNNNINSNSNKYFNSDNTQFYNSIIKNNNNAPCQPQTRDLKRRLHYAQNLSKMMPTQQSQAQSNFNSPFNSPTNIHPPLRNRYFI